MEIVYRRLKEGEAREYRALRLEALQTAPESFGKTYEEESATGELAFEKYIKEQDKERFVFGAFYNDQLLGMCCFNREQGIKRRHIALLTQMFVKSSHRSKNIGKELFHQLLKEGFNFKGLEQIILGVVGTNERAYRLYLRTGFIEFGYHKNYFKMNDTYLDERFMVLYKHSWNKNP